MAWTKNPNPDLPEPTAAEVLRDPKLAELLMRADEHAKGSPFDHYTKLQWLISKSKTEQGISWVFNAVSLDSEKDYLRSLFVVINESRLEC